MQIVRKKKHISCLQIFALNQMKQFDIAFGVIDHLFGHFVNNVADISLMITPEQTVQNFL